MKAQKTYLKGKSVFVVSILVIGITFLTVYLSGINYSRSVASNLYWSLSIIGIALFLFMTYGLYKGVGIVDNFPKFRSYKSGDFLPAGGDIPDWDMPDVDVGDGIGGLIMSILLWIGMTILFFIVLFLLEAVFWLSIFIIMGMLYWIFFRALRVVFSKSKETQGDIVVSAGYSLMYTTLYLGWIFGIVYLTEVFR